ncbi:Ribosomal RNA large subunit methyltransferase J [Pseudovibrio axinellae]|uniref:Ribosomal RNA large subunit methyltransferase J n=1 Tax=Pseudovibrio axinellae TaxID=989403 RepID=A0A166AV18_9HYPH|nr:23S rRNA (adenine(2030)-N(6))-methyltransferase RlmJ [Pseudovibrio axinellae]KZL21587.1 Ribosomal RNA large subunit methyltransferase J [Pseudovibrio axinellae]SER10659.1 23S rRNA (adenine2030-N6)-methyltransferase [Pseudovibrio axinellae]
MNYRHIYHAGNIGDVLKHIVLANILKYLQKKDAAYRVLDTHAGIGLYDLTSEKSQKTGEWQQGVGKVLENLDAAPGPVKNALVPWLETVENLNPGGGVHFYPGSPEIACMLARKQDRLTLTELHPEDFEELKNNYGGDKKVKVIALDAWLALGSFLPPKERRGVVLIDPAFEVEDEFDRLADGIIRGWKRWQTGIFAIWYPVKSHRTVDQLVATLKEAGIRNTIKLELSAGQVSSDQPMKSSGMLVINPPWTLTKDMNAALPWLCQTLSQGKGAKWSVEQVITE